jgi:hypothetical protein
MKQWVNVVYFRLDEILERNEAAEPKIFTTYAPAVIKKVVLQPIIYENGNLFYFFFPPLPNQLANIYVVVTEVIEEIQPIIHRTVRETHIVKKQEIVSSSFSASSSTSANQDIVHILEFCRYTKIYSYQLPLNQPLQNERLAWPRSLLLQFNRKQNELNSRNQRGVRKRQSSISQRRF